jgi:hypothetical protein
LRSAQLSSSAPPRHELSQVGELARERGPVLSHLEVDRVLGRLEGQPTAELEHVVAQEPRRARHRLDPVLVAQGVRPARVLEQAVELSVQLGAQGRASAREHVVGCRLGLTRALPPARHHRLDDREHDLGALAQGGVLGIVVEHAQVVLREPRRERAAEARRAAHELAPGGGERTVAELFVVGGDEGLERAVQLGRAARGARHERERAVHLPAELVLEEQGELAEAHQAGAVQLGVQREATGRVREHLVDTSQQLVVGEAPGLGVEQLVRGAGELGAPALGPLGERGEVVFSLEQVDALAVGAAHGRHEPRGEPQQQTRRGSAAATFHHHLGVELPTDVGGAHLLHRHHLAHGARHGLEIGGQPVPPERREHGVVVVTLPGALGGRHVDGPRSLGQRGDGARLQHVELAVGVGPLDVAWRAEEPLEPARQLGHAQGEPGSSTGSSLERVHTAAPPATRQASPLTSPPTSRSPRPRTASTSTTPRSPVCGSAEKATPDTEALTICCTSTATGPAEPRPA